MIKVYEYYNIKYQNNLILLPSDLESPPTNNPIKSINERFVLHNKGN